MILAGKTFSNGLSRACPALAYRLLSLATLCLILNACRDKSEAGQHVEPKVNLITLPGKTNLLSLPNAPITDRFNAAGSQAAASDPILIEAYLLDKKGKLDKALVQVASYIEKHPNDKSAYSLRADIYSQDKEWDKAREDYESILKLEPSNAAARFDLAELLFKQGKYDDARPKFADMKTDLNLGDLAAYKVFLCDLLVGHEEVAQEELEVFNQASANASYYFANAAWLLFHHRQNEAQHWLDSAARIYSPPKVFRYSSSLIDLGYLPLPSSGAD
jgi:Tfp pilus assembly protein PilF